MSRSGLAEKSYAMRWQQWEIEIIKADFPWIGHMCIKLPHRSYAAIVQKSRSIMGTARRADLWSPQELAVIYDHYPDVTKIQKLLPKRTRSAITTQAKVLGLQAKRHPLNAYQVSQVLKLFQTGSTIGDIAAKIGCTHSKVFNCLNGRGLGPGNVLPAVTGIKLLDSVRDECRRSGISLRKLRRTIGVELKLTNGSLSACIKAIEYLGGEIDIVWNED